MWEKKKKKGILPVGWAQADHILFCVEICRGGSHRVRGDSVGAKELRGAMGERAW